jgi:hypothetical protein
MCQNKDDKNILNKSIFRFYRNWIRQKNNNDELIYLKRSEEITYSKADFDYDLLTTKDKEELAEYSDDIMADREIVYADKKELGWENVPSEERQFLNLGNWLSLRHKGRILLEGFYKEVLPRIKKVHATQMYISLENEEGDLVRGYIDLICDWDAIDNTIVFDFKTSSVKYEDDSVKESEQLGLYSLALLEPPNNETIDIKIKQEGYIVLKKGLDKAVTKTCTKCGNVALPGGRAITCLNMVQGKKCGGQWARDVIFNGEYQIILDKVPESVKDGVIDKINRVNAEIKNGEFPMNTDSCISKFGRCEYFNFCHHNDSSSLIKKEGERK